MINEYNGLLINPDADSIYLSLKKLLDDSEKRIELAKRGYDTALYGLNYEMWKNRWTDIIYSVDRGIKSKS